MFYTREGAFLVRHELKPSADAQLRATLLHEAEVIASRGEAGRGTRPMPVFTPSRITRHEDGWSLTFNIVAFRAVPGTRTAREVITRVEFDLMDEDVISTRMTEWDVPDIG